MLRDQIQSFLLRHRLQLVFACKAFFETQQRTVTAARGGFMYHYAHLESQNVNEKESVPSWSQILHCASKKEALRRRLFHFCGVIGKIVTAIFVLLPIIVSRLETKSTAWHCNYSLWHWLIGKWEMGLKGWGAGQGAGAWLISTEGWAWVEQTRCSSHTFPHAHTGKRN